MQFALALHDKIQTRVAGQPVVDAYIHPRLPYTVQVLGGKFAGTSLVYLLHFEQKICHAHHYIGSTNDLERRLKEHRRTHPHYVWHGKQYRRYQTFFHALLQEYSCDYLHTHLVELMRQARRDNGVPLLMAINRAGISWQVAHVWQADRNFERYLKARKHASRFCPICQGVHSPF